MSQITDIQDDIISNKNIDKSFHPTMKNEQREKLYPNWQKAVKRAMNWEDE